ncbi:ribonuclease HII [Nocardioides sp.]|uniref:ribonuclease HII n=1 Tax=Nocardioides sp. TaxID=35761 RepID=UPI0035185640
MAAPAPRRPGAPARPSAGGSRPSLRFERSLLREGVVHLACADEVGRGALSGPVTIGMVVMRLDTPTAPAGVRDSKLLTPEARVRLAPRVRRWAVAHAVGHATAAEIDAVGIVAALRLAGHRALAGLDVRPDLVLLDGNHDYLRHRVGPEGADGEAPGEGAAHADLLPQVPPVVTRIKADLRCSGVAAASILAKTERDALMIALHDEHPGYGWNVNKGYAAPDHLEALRSLGPCAQHRRSWRLPGVVPDGAASALAAGGLESAS